MIEYIECPDTSKNLLILSDGYALAPSLFLAGGITGCPDWQSEIVEIMQHKSELEDFCVFNPRRVNFPIDDSSAARKQIEWEHDQLRLVSTILFWFPRETLCPITLYELGAWSMTDKRMVVGVHPNYKRRQDVEIQTRLARPDIHMVYSLPDLVNDLVRLYKPLAIPRLIVDEEKPLSLWKRFWAGKF